MALKQLPLAALHAAAAARMTEYAGWQLPLYYHSILEEAKACRHHSALFDLSHLLQSRLCISEAVLASRLHTKLPARPWQSKLALWLNERGGIEDDLMITRMGRESEWRMVSNAATSDKVWAGWPEIQPPPNGAAVLLGWQGPAAASILAEFGVPVHGLPFMHSLWHQGMLVTRCGYTGEDGFELGLFNCGDQAADWASRLAQRGVWAGLGARDVLRIEAGLRLYGREMRSDLTPADCGLGWLVNPEQRGLPTRRLVGWRATDGIRRLVPTGLFERVEITSACWSPHLDCCLGMALIRGAGGGSSSLEVAGRRLELQTLPFVPHCYVK